MNHKRQSGTRGLCGIFHACQPERSLAMTEANRKMESKDRAFPEGSCGTQGNFRVAVRFFDENEGECTPLSGARLSQ